MRYTWSDDNAGEKGGIEAEEEELKWEGKQQRRCKRAREGERRVTER